MIEKHKFKQAVAEVSEQEMRPALAEAVRQYGRRPGMIVLSPVTLAASIPFAGRRKGFLLELSRAATAPILLAHGSFPYERVAVPCLRVQGLQHALETALEMSSALNYEICALFARLSLYIADEEDARDFERIREMVADMSLIYKTGIRNVELKGNPVRAVVEALAGYNLMLTDTGDWGRQGFWQSLFQPDVSWHVARRAPVSTLLIPPLETVI
jgi:hypothetical protein